MRTRKSGSNPPDTNGVTNTVRGYAVTGRMKTSGNSNSKNNLVAANASRKRK